MTALLDVRPNLARIFGTEFSGAMAHQIALRNKTCTRRCLGPAWLIDGKPMGAAMLARITDVTVRDPFSGRADYAAASILLHGKRSNGVLHPPVQVGDVLYVREPFWAEAQHDGLAPSALPVDAQIVPVRNNSQSPDGFGRYRPGRFMPRRLSQQTLIVRRLKVHRLQSISPDEAFVEGFGQRPRGWAGAFGRRRPSRKAHIEAAVKGHEAFKRYWTRLHGPTGRNSWDANPVVVAIYFRCIAGNVDQLIKKRELA